MKTQYIVFSTKLRNYYIRKNSVFDSEQFSGLDVPVTNLKAKTDLRSNTFKYIPENETDLESESNKLTCQIIIVSAMSQGQALCTNESSKYC